jgi:tRNA(Met) C34 N-acetyltransferase TmcA
LIKKIVIITVLIIIIALLLLITASQGRGKFQYVGNAVCAECHSEEAIGNQMKIWLASPHSRAFSILSSNKAKEIAKRYGIADPAADTRCLKCHTAGGG